MPLSTRTAYRFTSTVAWFGFPLSLEQRADIERRMSQMMVEEYGAQGATTTSELAPTSVLAELAL